MNPFIHGVQKVKILATLAQLLEYLERLSPLGKLILNLQGPSPMGPSLSTDITVSLVRREGERSGREGSNEKIQPASNTLWESLGQPCQWPHCPGKGKPDLWEPFHHTKSLIVKKAHVFCSSSSAHGIHPTDTTTISEHWEKVH